MGMAYFIALDVQEPGFDTFVNGKAIARSADSLRAMTERLDLIGLDDFTDFGGAGEDFELPDELVNEDEQTR